ncbi:MAG: glycosyltransferase family 4 protein [Burkholderiales bacterium]|nr:glycosyltransferase family 4 protein [Bacteroidia bacterium]
MYFKNRGYRVFFLTTCQWGSIHEELKAKGVRADEIKISKSFSLIYYIKMILFLIRYSKKNNIGVIHSHLQVPNLVSSISRFFIKAKVFNVRHNSDVIELGGSSKEKVIEKVINRLSDHIIAISDKVKTQLIDKEGVNSKKIYRINNGYRFSDYENLSINENEYLKIKAKYHCRLLIVSPGRLIKTKRHEITIKGIKELQLKGYDAQLLILGEGPEHKSIETFIKQTGIEEWVHLLGYIPNISDYLKASDIVVLLSESEASSNIVKEAGYFEKPVIVCENVGDFSDYIVNGQNGFLLSKEDPLSEFIKLIESVYTNKELLKGIGAKLKNSILAEFDIELVGKQYEELQNK